MDEGESDLDAGEDGTRQPARDVVGEEGNVIGSRVGLSVTLRRLLKREGEGSENFVGVKNF